MEGNVDSIITGEYDTGGCITLIDSTLLMYDDSIFRNNKGSYIIGVSRRKETFNNENITQIVTLDNTQSIEDISTTFLYFFNMTNYDTITIKNSQFNSSNYDYAMYIHSKLDLSNGNGEIITVNVANSEFNNLNRVAIMWTSQTNEIQRVEDGINGNV